MILALYYAHQIMNNAPTVKDISGRKHLIAIKNGVGSSILDILQSSLAHKLKSVWKLASRYCIYIIFISAMYFFCFTKNYALWLYIPVFQYRAPPIKSKRSITREKYSPLVQRKVRNPSPSNTSNCSYSTAGSATSSAGSTRHSPQSQQEQSNRLSRSGSKLKLQ